MLLPPPSPPPANTLCRAPGFAVALTKIPKSSQQHRPERSLGTPRPHGKTGEPTYHRGPGCFLDATTVYSPREHSSSAVAWLVLVPKAGLYALYQYMSCLWGVSQMVDVGSGLSQC